jgi:sigma-E factor negative regulatory protein RseA
MTDHNKAQISALMDGELDDMAVKKLLEDRSIQQCWQRYHIISDVMHNHTPLNTDTQLARRISELIKAEPVLLAPTPSRTLPAFLRPVAGMAVAATVAAMAILGVQQYRAGQLIDTPAPVAANMISAPMPENRAGVPVQVAEVDVERPVQRVIQTPDYVPASVNNVKMSRYILNHNEYQTNTGVHGLSPHVRLVATERK